MVCRLASPCGRGLNLLLYDSHFRRFNIIGHSTMRYYLSTKRKTAFYRHVSSFIMTYLDGCVFITTAAVIYSPERLTLLLSVGQKNEHQL